RLGTAGDFKHVSQLGRHFRTARDDETVWSAVGLFGQLVGTFRTAQPEGDRVGQERHACGRGRALRGPTAQGAGERAQDFRRRRLAWACGPYGPSGPAGAERRSAAARAKASIMLLRVAAWRRCSGASHTTAAPKASATMRPASGGKISHGTSSVVAKNNRSQCRR